MAEGARDEGRHRDIGAVLQRGFDRIARQRQFADVEFRRAESAEKDFLRHQRHIDRIDTVDLHAAVDQGAGAVVIADRDGEVELGHFASLDASTVTWSRQIAASGGPCQDAIGRSAPPADSFAGIRDEMAPHCLGGCSDAAVKPAAELRLGARRRAARL